jgi:protein phosphatase 2C family protein 2/3
MKKHAMRLFFEDAEFPQASQDDKMFAESVEDSVRKAFLRADLALADDSLINRCSGTTALTALVIGRLVECEKPSLFVMMRSSVQ